MMLTVTGAVSSAAARDCVFSDETHDELTRFGVKRLFHLITIQKITSVANCRTVITRFENKAWHRTAAQRFSDECD